MSAIAGIVRLNGSGQLSKEDLAPMLEAMKPPLPCKVETYSVPECSAVFGRVAYTPEADSALDHTMPSDIPQVLLAGELYNDEVKGYGSACDFLLQKYRKNKVEDFAAGLNGAFAAVIVDRSDRSVTLITDHTASRGLFTTVHKGKFYFASEVKGLMAVRDIPCRPDMLAVLSLAASGFLIGRRTLVENVNQMDYATVCRIRDGKVESWPYWRFLIEPERNRGRKTYIAEFADVLHRAVQRRMGTDRCAVLLSGGVDSRGIIACIEELGRVQVINHTFTTKEDRNRLGDWATAERVTEKLGVPLLTFRVDSSDSVSALRDSVYCSDGAAGLVAENIFDRIREEATVAYVFVGDECMGLVTGPMSNARLFPSAGICPLKGLGDLQDLLRKDKLNLFLGRSEEELEALAADLYANTPCDRADELYFQQHIIHCIHPKRRVVMRHGLNVRTPWLDPEVLNFIRKLPAGHRNGKKLFRDTIVHINPGLFEIPRARIRESKAVAYRAELGTLERERKGVSEIILKDNPLLEEFFDISPVQALINKVSLSPSPVQRRRSLNLPTLLPIGVQLWLGGVRNYLINPAPQLSNENLLLRLMVVAETLRQLKDRFAAKSF